MRRHRPVRLRASAGVPAIVLVPLLLALAPSGPEGAGRWVDVELPEGFHLDLRSGEVTSRLPAVTEGVASYVDGRLHARPPLRSWEGGGAERVAAVLPRDGGRAANTVRPARGDELLFDVDDRTWGYLRVLDVAPGSLRLEYARARSGDDRLRREPSGLEVTHPGRGVALAWRATPGAEYEVRRSIVGRPDARDVLLGTLRGERFEDGAAPPGAVLEYRVRRIDGEFAERPFGARARAAVELVPSGWPIALDNGSRVDLLSGELDGPDAQLEVLRATPPHLQMRPLGGARLAVLGPREQASWALPAPEVADYADALRTLQPTDELAVQLPQGAFARVRFGVDEGDRAWLVRELDLEGDRLLPRPPGAPSAHWSADGVAFRFAPLSGVADADAVMIVAEREIGFLRDVWEEVMVGEPGARDLSVPLAGASAEPSLVRYRFRHRYPWSALSPAGAPVRVVHGDAEDPAVVEALLDRAFADLVHVDFERRVAARGILEALGRAAWPRLREALSSDQAELAAAARDLLLSVGDEAHHLEMVLRSRAEREHVGGDPPDAAWFDPEPLVRSLAFLRSLGSEDTQALDAWLGVSAVADPDASVSRFARLLLERPERAPLPSGAPLALQPPARRPAAARVDWRAEFRDDPAPAEVLALARASADPTAPAKARLVLQVAHELEIRLERSRDVELDLDAIELALRLVERTRGEGDGVRLRAAASFVPSTGAALRAARELVDLRLAAPEPVGRRRVELPSASLEALVATLISLEEEGASYVDVVLPPGDYGEGEPSADAAIDLHVPGLRLLAQGEVRLGTGIRVQKCEDVVLQGLRIDARTSHGLAVVDGSAVAVDCRIAGADTGLWVQSARLELSRCEVGESDAGRRGNWAARLLGPAELVARESLFAAGSIYAGEEGFVVLDRCVVDAGERILVQGQRGGEVILRDAFLKGSGAGVTHVETVLVEGVLLDVASSALGQGTPRVELCPEHVLLPDAALELNDPTRLVQCPLRTR